MILFITGAAKVWSVLGGAKILAQIDPVFGLQFGRLMFVAGILELMIGGICLFSKSRMLALMLVAWLATNLSIYRMGLWYIGWHRPCACLGNLTDAIHVSPQTADTTMKIILAYLLIGSYSFLFWFWRQHRKAEGRT